MKPWLVPGIYVQPSLQGLFFWFLFFGRGEGGEGWGWVGSATRTRRNFMISAEFLEISPVWRVLVPTLLVSVSRTLFSSTSRRVKR